jgi:hypothetical protein
MNEHSLQSKQSLLDSWHRLHWLEAQRSYSNWKWLTPDDKIIEENLCFSWSKDGVRGINFIPHYILSSVNNESTPFMEHIYKERPQQSKRHRWSLITKNAWFKSKVKNWTPNVVRSNWELGGDGHDIAHRRNGTWKALRKERARVLIRRLSNFYWDLIYIQ